MHDYVLKEVFGDSAVNVLAKVVMFRSNPNHPDKTEIYTSAVGGIFVPDITDPDGDGEYEMWECEIVIIPYRKYRGSNIPGAKLDQMLTSSFGNAENWKEEFYDKDK